MTSPFIYMNEGIRFFKRRINVSINGTKKYHGDHKKICQNIIDDCWNGTFFQTSTGHFSQFYIRDISYYVEDLIKLGYKDKVKKTFIYALKQYKKYNKMTTTLSKMGVPFDVYTYAIDSLPLFLRSLRLIGDKNIIKNNKDYLECEIKKFYDIAIEKRTGLITDKRFFSSAKDNAKRKSSMYSNVMIWILQNETKNLGLYNPLQKYNYKKSLYNLFWTGEYFLDDLSGNRYVAGDANTIPYWAGLFTDKKMINKSIRAIRNVKLDKPFPLKYTNKKIEKQYLKLQSILVPNYEGNAIWMQWALIYLKVVKMTDKSLAMKYLKTIKELIQNNKNYLEIFNPDGSIYKTPFYHSDEGMIWCAGYLGLID